MDTKTSILNLAEKLIRTRGYHAFSYQDISVPLKIKNAAVHYHFPAKADLGQAVIQRTIDSFKKKVILWKSSSPDDQLDKFLDIYKSSYERNLVCIMGALGPAYDSLPTNMQAALSEVSEQIREWLISVLKEGKENGHFSFSEKIEEKSDLIVTSLLSSLIVSKVSKDNVFQSVRGAILKTT